jgi:hypothetical protein
MVQAVKPGGHILDLQVIRPNPRIESGGRFLGEVDGEPLLRKADAATAAIDAQIEQGQLVEEDVDDHDVLQHFATGAELIADFANRERRLHEATLPTLRSLTRPCTMREKCRLRRLAVR